MSVTLRVGTRLTSTARSRPGTGPSPFFATVSGWRWPRSLAIVRASKPKSNWNDTQSIAPPPEGRHDRAGHLAVAGSSPLLRRANRFHVGALPPGVGALFTPVKPTILCCKRLLFRRAPEHLGPFAVLEQDRKSTRLNSSHLGISYAVFCLKKKK